MKISTYDMYIRKYYKHIVAKYRTKYAQSEQFQQSETKTH